MRRERNNRERKQAVDNPPASASGELIAAAALLAICIVVTFFPASGFRFISLDDPQYVSANPRVLSGLSLDGIKWAFTTTSFYWHPLTWISHMIDVELFGPAPGAHHMINVLFHAASSIVLFAALARMTKSIAASLVTAVLFALHPLHVESVAWIAERKDVLSTLMWMICLLLYADHAIRPRMSRMLLIAFVFALGLLAKPMILTLPFVLLLLDAWPLQRLGSEWRTTLPRLISEKLVLFALSLASLVVTLFSQRGSRAVVSLEALSAGQRIGNAIVSYMMYLRDMLWPMQLAPFYPLQPPTIMNVAGAALLIAAITIATMRFAKSRPFLLVGWLWYLVTLAPVIGLVQAGDQGRADRFTYVPLIGVFIAITWLVRSAVVGMRLSRPVRYAGIALVTVVLAVLTRRQLMFWKDDLTLWGRTVAVTSGNYRAENLYGVALTDNGRLEEGIVHYEAALKAWPANPEAHNNLGAARMDQGRYQDAVSEFEAALRGKPRDPNFNYNLAVALDAAGRRADAIERVKAGLAIDPSFPSLLEAARLFGIQTGK